MDLLDESNYGTSDNNQYRYTLVLLDSFSEYGWCFPLGNNYSQTLKQVSQNLLLLQNENLKIRK